MKVGIVGTGYVGLVSGTCFAQLGNEVMCVDVDAAKVEAMQHGTVPIYEPGLEAFFAQNAKEGRLHFTTKLRDMVNMADIIFLALPTPPGEDGSADLSYILGVADELGPLLTRYTVIVNKSTVPVGTAEKVRERIAKHAAVPFDVVSNPEFLREGLAVHDFMEPDRIVIGSSSARAKEAMEELYAPITRQGFPIIHMDERSAEVTKYAANSFLAVKITFMNQIANVCEAVGADVDSVRLGVGSDNRIGSRFLFPGIGYGGSCFPKDIEALVHTAKKAGYDFSMLSNVVALNTAQQRRLQQKIKHFFKRDLRGKKIALWGLAFKQDTDDVRQAPALHVVRDLVAEGVDIVAFDPEGMANAKKALQDVQGVRFVKDEYEALKGADALVIATEWPQFGSASLDRIKSLLAQPVVFDGRNMFALDDMRTAGFYYESIGRAVVDGRL